VLDAIHVMEAIHNTARTVGDDGEVLAASDDTLCHNDDDHALAFD
jgi:hypothetical protein